MSLNMQFLHVTQTAPPPRMYNHADVRDDDSWTPLYNACYMGHKDVVQYLVEMANCDISEYNTAPK